MIQAVLEHMLDRGFGYTDTNMIAAIPGNVLERYVSQIPVGRLGRPEGVTEGLPHT